jgi:S1-C subfamily serine protease
MKQLLMLLVAVLVSVSVSYVTSFAQQPGGHRIVRTIGGPGSFDGQPFSLGELGAIIAKDSSGLSVIFVGPDNMRSKAYQSVDLRQGDRILMGNGKKLNSSEELQKLYDSLAVGADLQLGVKRDGQLLIISLPKADPKDLPKRQMMVMKSDDKGNMDMELGGKKMKMAEGVTDVDHVPGLGILVGMKAKKVAIAAIMPFAADMPELKNLSMGDEVLSVAGKPAGTTADFITAYENTKVGDTFSFKVMHGGKETEISLTKQEDKGIKIINKK